ncbi:MAG TPA: M28 family peptidase, partial [Candidatus Solibacter sp.]
ARVASTHDFESSILFIAFDLEELGLIGSKAWVADHPSEQIAGMIALDQVSFNWPGATHNLIAICPPDTRSNPTRAAFENAVRSYSGGLTPVYGGVTSTSDHASFAALTSAAISVVEASWSYNTKMHTSADSVDQPDYIDTVFATQVTRSVVAWLASQAGAIPEPANEMRLRPGGILNASNFVGGVAAASELITLKGSGLTDPSGATTVTLRDSAGASSTGELIYLSDSQINLVLPAALTAGRATLTVTRGDGLQQSAALTIGPIAPGIFTADATGLGPAAAHAIRVAPDGSQSLQNVSDCSTGICAAIPIAFGAPDDRVVLVLYGTGIRGRSALSAVHATVGSLALPCQYAGPHPLYSGLDQVNIELPRSLRGLGSLPVELSVEGSTVTPVVIYLGAD